MMLKYELTNRVLLDERTRIVLHFHSYLKRLLQANIVVTKDFLSWIINGLIFLSYGETKPYVHQMNKRNLFNLILNKGFFLVLFYIIVYKLMFSLLLYQKIVFFHISFSFGTFIETFLWAYYKVLLFFLS